MTIEILNNHFSVCKVNCIEDIDLSDQFCFISKTDEEVSLVCRTELVPAITIEREDGWRGFRVKGVLDFSLVGILAKISTLLADHGISLFAISTYNTDYILVKVDDFDQTIAVLEKTYQVSYCG